VKSLRGVLATIIACAQVGASNDGPACVARKTPPASLLF